MKAINALSKNYQLSNAPTNAADMLLVAGDNSENTQHTQAKNDMIFAYFTLERKSLPCKAYGIRLTEVLF